MPKLAQSRAAGHMPAMRLNPRASTLKQAAFD